MAARTVKTINDIRFDVKKSGTAINMVYTHMQKNGELRVLERSGDVTLDMVDALARSMALKLAHKKKKDNLGYVGYNVGGVGKLIFIPEDHDFYVRKPFDI